LSDLGKEGRCEEEQFLAILTEEYLEAIGTRRKLMAIEVSMERDCFLANLQRADDRGAMR
jgi:hypothetical protein